MKKWSILFVFLFNICLLPAQKLNGVWEGTLRTDGDFRSFTIKMEIIQDGSAVSGISELIYPRNGISIKFKMKGTYENDQIKLSEYEVISSKQPKNHVWCVKDFLGDVAIGRSKVIRGNWDSQEKVYINGKMKKGYCKKGRFNLYQKEIHDPVIELSKDIAPIYTSESFINDNIITRGYIDPKLLAVEGTVAYYWVRGDIKRKYGESRNHPKLLAIHNLGEQSPIVSYDFETKQLPFFTEKLLPHFPNARNVTVEHFVQDNHFQLEKKEPSHIFYGIEDGLIETTYNLNRTYNEWKVTNLKKDRYANSIADLQFIKNKTQEGRIQFEQKKKEQFTKQKNAIEQEQLKTKALHKELNYPYFEDSFWNQFEIVGSTLRKVYEGKSRENANINTQLMFTSHVSHISNYCRSLLPQNYKTITFKEEIPGSSYNNVYWLPGGGMLMQTHYEPNQVIVTEVSLDPSLETLYTQTREKNKAMVFKKLMDATFTDDDISKRIDNKILMGLPEIKKFNDALGCNARARKLFGENLVRLLNNQYSIQEEELRNRNQSLDAISKLKVNPIYLERGRRKQTDYYFRNPLPDDYSYRAEIQKLEWIPKEGSYKTGTYVVEIKDPIYLDVPSKIFHIPGIAPDDFSELDKKDFLSGKKKEYWINLYFRESKIKNGELNQTPDIFW